MYAYSLLVWSRLGCRKAKGLSALDTSPPTPLLKGEGRIEVKICVF